jgi:hypothetical protein
MNTLLALLTLCACAMAHGDTFLYSRFMPLPDIVDLPCATTGNAKMIIYSGELRTDYANSQGRCVYNTKGTVITEEELESNCYRKSLEQWMRQKSLTQFQTWTTDTNESGEQQQQQQAINSSDGSSFSYVDVPAELKEESTNSICTTSKLPDNFVGNSA